MAAGTISRQYPPGGGVASKLANLERVAARADSAEILVLGNSHAHAFDETLLGGRVARIGLAWNDAFEVEHQVQVLLPDMPRLRAAIIAISYTTFHRDNALGDHDRFIDSRRLFYAEYPLGGWIRGAFGTYAVARTYWLSRSDHWYGVVAGLRHGENDETDERPALSEAELDEHAEIRAAQFIESAEAMEELDPGLPKATYGALSRTIALLREHGVDVVLLTPPYHHSYDRRMAESTYPSEARWLARRLAREHRVTWIDAGGLEDFAFRNALFRDSDHLNGRGRSEFTRWLLEEMGTRLPAVLVEEGRSSSRSG
jgi:hypothetical protein